jgi:hypothetical protein
MKEKIDYSEIDEFCIPSIKFLNDEMNFETLNSCQGLCKEDRLNQDPRIPSHSLYPYIQFKYSKEVKNFCEWIVNEEGSSVFKDLGLQSWEYKVTVRPILCGKRILLEYHIYKDNGGKLKPKFPTKIELECIWNLFYSKLLEYHSLIK